MPGSLPASRVAFCCLLLGALSAPGQTFLDVANFSGLSAIAPNLWTHPQERGACWGDFDGDGDQDLLVPGLPGLANRIFVNTGAGTFIETGAVTGLGFAISPRATIAGDIDNDGDLDVYMAHAYNPGQLFLNNGLGTFTEIGVSAGIAQSNNTFAAAFGDYDRDGFIDLYLGNHVTQQSAPVANVLFRNNGNSTFTDMTATAGVGDLGLTFAALWYDYDEDGWIDLFVGNDRGYHPLFQPDATYRNNGDGTFTNVSSAINTGFGIGAMGADVGDVFNDGGWDVFVSNEETGHVFHEWDPATAMYVDTAATHQILGFQEGWACHILDYDNDGWQDIYVNHNTAPLGYGTNAMFKNPGPAGGPWADVGAALGVDLFGLKLTNSYADFDDDGDLDILQYQMFNPTAFLRNDATSGNGWIKFRTTGTRSNRDGIGAVISVTTGQLTQRRLVKSGTGYLSSSDLRPNFGLGAAPIVDKVEVRWPSGQIQILSNVATNQIVDLVEPDLSLSTAPLIGTAPNLVLSVPTDAGLPYLCALTLVTTPGLPLSDGRVIPVVPGDPLALLTIVPNNPILPAPFGFLSNAGEAQTTFGIPGDPVLIGLSIYATALTADASLPDGIRTVIDPPLTVTFQ